MVEAENIQALLKEYPYLKDIAQTHLLLTESDYKKYEKDAQLKYGFAKTISINLFQELFLNPHYYVYVEKLFNDEINQLVISYVSNGDTMGRIELTKSELLTSLKKIVVETNNEQLAFKYQFLANLASFAQYQKKVAKEEVTYNIEGQDYTFKMQDFITFLTLDNFDFVRICLDNEIKTIKGVAKKYFFYALSKSITQQTLDNYLFSQSFVTHYQDLTSYSLVDYQAINTLMTTQDPNISQIQVNQELHDLIYRDMPQDYTTLEKAIYIYIKLCKTLTYDEEFYAGLQRGKVAEKHEDIKHVATISPTNNKVVCYEFTAIYGKLLNELGLNYKNYQTFEEKFGGGHAMLYFRLDKFLISADAVVTILQGDIAEAKFNHPLKGLHANNRSPETRAEFKKAFLKVYEYLARQDKSIGEYPFMQNESFAQIVAKYRQLNPKLPDITLAERLDILLARLNDINKVGIDNLTYLVTLRKILFSEEELRNIIKFTIISNSETLSQETIRASVIITVNENGLRENPEANAYYLYNPNESIQRITKEEIIKNLTLNIYHYLNTVDIIPGINYGGRK